MPQSIDHFCHASRSRELRLSLLHTCLYLAGALMIAAPGGVPAWAQDTHGAPHSGTSTLAPAATQGGARAAVSASPPIAKPARNKGAPVYHLIGFRLSGTNRVDTDALLAALPQHAGDPITHEQIKDDADRVRAVLKARHVHGEMTTATLERDGPGEYVMVVWEVHLLDALSYARYDGVRHFAGQTFSGNAALGMEQLAAATGLKAGQPMPDGSVGEARTGIEQAYDKALPGRAVDVKGKILLKKDHTVQISWRITEANTNPHKD